jgi:hypothetical protein
MLRAVAIAVITPVVFDLMIFDGEDIRALAEIAFNLLN